MARRFIANEPPWSASLVHYGETFPRFLRSLGKTASIEYMADIAELEMAQIKAGGVAHALPLDSETVFSISAEKRGGARVVLHPSVLLVASRFPIVTIWKGNRLNGETTIIDRWRPECALVARPFDKVEVRCLPDGGYAFIGALAEGRTMATAIDAGKCATPN